MEKHRFEINEPEKKKFVIDEPKKFGTKGRFEIIQSKPNWFKQENSNDCGPCLILNALAELGIQTLDTNIQSVRNKVNESRGPSNQMAPDAWLRSTDVGQYFYDAGLSVDEYTIRPFDKQESRNLIRQIFNDRSFDFIYITLGSHFRGIVNKEGQLILLDSFKNGPENISVNSAWNLIEETIRVSNGTSMHRVGIVKKGTPHYRTL